MYQTYMSIKCIKQTKKPKQNLRKVFAYPAINLHFHYLIHLRFHRELYSSVYPVQVQHLQKTFHHHRLRAMD